MQEKVNDLREQTEELIASSRNGVPRHQLRM